MSLAKITEKKLIEYSERFIRDESMENMQK